MQSMYQKKTRRQLLELNRSQMDNERQSFMAQWRDIGDYLLPRRPRFNTTDNNRGDRRSQKIVDSTASFSLRTCRSGMQAGITSPARPWFRLSVADKELVESEPIKDWLYRVTERMSQILLKSNFYNCSPNMYGDLAGFGTACMLIEPDMDTVVRFYNIPIGSYMLANDEKLQVRNFCRELRFTVRQLVEKFGRLNPDDQEEIDWTKFSDTVKTAWECGHTETWIEVCHQILPNPDFNPRMLEAKYKRYLSVYYERSASNSQSNDDIFLRESGYDYFPILAPRWETSGEDVYGTNCPGMEALGDIRALQLMQRRKAQAVDKMVNPPMIASGNMKNRTTSSLPGSVTYIDPSLGGAGFAPAYQVNPQVGELVNDIQDIRGIIRRAFFEDLFLMLAQSDRRQITAREIDERREEKLLALGPVLEQLNQDGLDPLITILFAEMESQGYIPEPPEDIQGADLKVEYISVMAQSQKLIGIGTVERFLGFAGQVMQISPQVGDKINFDQMIDVYGDLTSIPPGIIKSDDMVAMERDQRAQQAAQAQQMEASAMAAQSAKALSQSSMEGDNALTRMVQDAEAGAMA